MSRLEVRLLGGFDVSCDGKPIQGFESQKVRALLAYLIVNRRTAHSRDRLAGLLWPTKDEETARQNLRQAVYNLRTILSRCNTSKPLLLTTRKSLQFNPRGEYWLDVAAFEEAVRRGMETADQNASIALAEAAELYQGDFLAGFFLKESPEFEHWLFYEQERLREMAVQTLRRLIDDHLKAGAYRLGIRYARRLLEIDPLFEEAHRKLMRLYALSGRRTRALAQYEEYRALLRFELGVEPLEETTALYHAIQTRQWPVEPRRRPAATLPALPFAGRAAVHTALQRTWDEIAPGTGRVTLIEGEAGAGKTRLVEELLREIEEDPHVLVLRGCAVPLAVLPGCRPVAQALRRLVMEQPSLARRAWSQLPETYVADLVRVVPEFQALRAQPPTSVPYVAQGAGRRLFEAVACFLEALAGGAESPPRKLVLFLDDLHWAPRSTLALVEFLVQRLAHAPIWLLGTYRPEALDGTSPLHSLGRHSDGALHVERVTLERLNASAVAQIAASLVTGDQTAALAEILYRKSGGLPLALAQWLYRLVDEELLTPSEEGEWRLSQALSPETVAAPESLSEVIMGRVSRLPASARRLLTLAAVMGPVFEVAFLGEVAGEQQAVVDAGVETWLRRGMVREVSPPFALSQWALATVGGRSRRFLAFTHEEIRRAIYSSVNVRRRQLMHRQVAEALEREWAENPRPVCELIAHHYTAAGAWEAALPYLREAGQKAYQTLDCEAALDYCDRALEVLERLVNSATTERERRKWLRQRFAVLTTHAEVCEVLERAQQWEADVRAMWAIAAELGDSAPPRITDSFVHEK